MRDPVDSVCYLPPSNFRDFCVVGKKIPSQRDSENLQVYQRQPQIL